MKTTIAVAAGYIGFVMGHGITLPSSTVQLKLQFVAKSMRFHLASSLSGIMESCCKPKLVEDRQADHVNDSFDHVMSMFRNAITAIYFETQIIQDKNVAWNVTHFHQILIVLQ